MQTVRKIQSTRLMRRHKVDLQVYDPPVAYHTFQMKCLTKLIVGKVAANRKSENLIKKP